MQPALKIIGVHPVQGSEPCHLIEASITDWQSAFDFAAITQADPSLPKSNWQVAYDERLLEETGGQKRFAFFFQYLDISKPLQTPAGDMLLPCPTPVPPHLKSIEYLAP